MSPIPWAAILTHGPAVLAAARSLLANQSRKAGERNQNPDTRLDQLENASVETARLLQELAEQVQALTLAQQEIHRKIRVALIAGIVGAALAVIAVTLAITN
jgi:hypothetical protein